MDWSRQGLSRAWAAATQLWLWWEHRGDRGRAEGMLMNFGITEVHIFITADLSKTVSALMDGLNATEPGLFELSEPQVLGNQILVIDACCTLALLYPLLSFLLGLLLRLESPLILNYHLIIILVASQALYSLFSGMLER